MNLQELKKLIECFHEESVVNCGGLTYGDILKLIALVEIQHEALKLWKIADFNSEEIEFDEMAHYAVPMPLQCDAQEAGDEALAAYEAFGKGE